MFNSNFLSKMTKKSFNLRSVAKIGVTCLAVCMMFASCGGKDKDGDNDDDTVGKGTGKIEISGKTFNLNECLIVGASTNPPLSWLQLKYNDDSNKKIVISISVTKGNFSAKTYTSEVTLIQMDYDDTEAMGGASTDNGNGTMIPNMVVTKSGNDFDITLTAKVLSSGGVVDFKMTYKGKIGGL